MPTVSNKTQSTTRYDGSNNVVVYTKNSNVKVQGGKATNAARINDERKVHFSELPMNNNQENIFISGYESSPIGVNAGLTPYFMSPNTLEIQRSTSEKQIICSPRTKFLTFLIVVGIVVAAGIAIAVVFATVGIRSNQVETTGGTAGVLLSLATLSPTVPISVISIGSQNGGAPCSSYTTINDPSRNVNQTIQGGSCDNGPIFNGTNGGAWIRFIGSGGTVIPMYPTKVNRCGGYVTGWFNGSLPTLVGASSSGSICLSHNIGDCLSTQNTSVVLCSGLFYVYFLEPMPVCNARYCTE